MKTYSSAFRELIYRTGAAEAPLLLLEITHPQLASPARLVNDSQDLVSNGDLYVAIAFRATLPEDMDQGLPRAVLAIDNVGRALTDWIEGSAGGADAQVRVMQILRSDPDNIEFELTLTGKNVRMNLGQVTAQLGYDDILNRSACAVSYRPDVAPGLF